MQTVGAVLTAKIENRYVEILLEIGAKSLRFSGPISSNFEREGIVCFQLIFAYFFSTNTLNWELTEYTPNGDGRAISFSMTGALIPDPGNFGVIETELRQRFPMIGPAIVAKLRSLLR